MCADEIEERVYSVCVCVHLRVCGVLCVLA